MPTAIPSLESFFATFNILDLSVSPDQSQVVFCTNISGQYDLWGLDPAVGYPYPLTRQGQIASFIRHLPQQAGILTGFDHDGDENWQMYSVPITGGELQPVLTKPGEKYYFGDITADGRYLYYYTSEDNPVYQNIGRLELATGQREILLRGVDGPLSVAAVSPDGSSFAYKKAVGNTKVLGLISKGDTSVCVTSDLETLQRTYAMKYWDADTVYVLTNYGQERAYLARFQISTGELHKLAEVEDGDLVDMALDPAGNRIVLKAGGGVEDLLCAYDLETECLHELSAPTPVINKLIAADDGSMYLVGRSAVTPANIFVSADGMQWSALTQHRIMGVEEEQLSQPEVVRYPSFDDLEIEGLFFPPAGELDNGHTVLIPHGGPQAADRKMFRPLVQYLCLQGYRVFSPNYRGSTGYGESFTNMVNKDWGGGPRLDIVAGMQWLDRHGRTDAGKWFCVGGSYGGYMTLLLHGRHPGLFKAFVDQFGPSNLFTTLKTAPKHWKEEDAELIGDAVKDKDKLIEDSPMTYLDNMTKPMLVVQGANDPRVVQQESDDIVAALRGREQDVEYLLLPDEGHGYSKTANMVKVYKAIVEFLERYL